VRHVAYLPLSRLLPRTSALVHHGGIGSAAAALSAGVPQLLVPFAHDQPDNAARLCRLGVASVLWPAHATGPRMARRLARILGSPSLRTRCQSLAAAIRPGIGDACEALERYAAERSSHASSAA
jgi:UDP:flavonoid glycosyltransferase YjiC (YdhE family)